jgi:predicted transcriptional regulator of viral defense system
MKKPRQLRFDAAKSDVLHLFREQSKRLFTYADLQSILEENREFWRLTKSTTLDDFIEFLTKYGRLDRIEINFLSRKMIRYIWGNASAYEVALSWHPASYLSHYTAVYLHDLTEQIPKMIYLNVEQPRKTPPPRKLDQANIDTAFKRPMRRSKAVAPFGDFEICLLSSMGGLNLGVVESDGPEGEKIRLTNVERTLIDITVRPGYAGGVFEVLKAFRNAKGKVSINRLAAMLKTLDYVYPYHQAIGFYLERTGAYDEPTLRLLRKFELKYDFYITYDMRDPEYSKEWRLFFPKGL